MSRGAFGESDIVHLQTLLLFLLHRTIQKHAQDVYVRQRTAMITAYRK